MKSQVTRKIVSASVSLIIGLTSVQTLFGIIGSPQWSTPSPPCEKCDSECPPGSDGGSEGGTPGCQTCVTASAGGGMPIWRVRENQVDYRLFDNPLTYTPAYGPAISLKLVYQTWRPTGPEYYPRNDANPLFGSQWHCLWSSDLVISDKVYWNYLGGRIIYSFGADPLFSKPAYVGSSRVEILKDGGNNVIGGKIHTTDGNLMEYSQAYTATQFLLSKVTDANGNALSFTYDGYGRLNQITAATGETTTFVYGDLNGDGDPSNDRVVTQVNAPGGYTATFSYETNGDWYLTNITDAAGIASAFTYHQDQRFSGWDFFSIETLNTPYGTTRFEYLESPPLLRRGRRGLG